MNPGQSWTQASVEVRKLVHHHCVHMERGGGGAKFILIRALLTGLFFTSSLPQKRVNDTVLSCCVGACVSRSRKDGKGSPHGDGQQSGRSTRI